MKSSVIVFPGSNCDRDVQVALEACGADVAMVWHADSALPKSDLVVLPGGFSYGDYLRSGAMAAQSPILKEVISHANNGGYVLGICNGFQVLTETHLLPGTMMRNTNLHFVCKDVFLKVENNDTAFTRGYKKGQIVSIPIAHHDGNYFVSDDDLKMLENNNQIAFRYVNENGDITDDVNPNGSVSNIAGVFNKNKTILGMMPHPERVADPALGGEDGHIMLEHLVHFFD